jgi:hypothetical protein
VRLRAYALALSLIGASATAQAQAQPEAATRRIAFLVPALDATTRGQLREALLAQSAMLGAEIVLLDEAADAPNAPARARAEAAREAAREAGAALVLWLDTSSEVAWSVHVLDMEQERAVARRIETRDTTRAASIEAVAVLTREASRAVFAKRERPPEPEPPAPAPPEPKPEPEPAAPVVPAPAAPEPREPSRKLRLALSYQGTDFAPQTSFAHGVSFSARTIVWKQAYAGLGLGWFTAEQPANTGLSVQRIPLSAAGGFRTSPLPPIELDLELALTVEILQRTTNITPAPGTTVSSDRTRALAGLGPRLRAELKPSIFIGFFLGAGFDFLVTRLAYQGRNADGSPTVFLHPHRIRPAIELGIAAYP